MRTERIKTSFLVTGIVCMSFTVLATSLWRSSGSSHVNQVLVDRVGNLKAENIKIESSTPGLKLVKLRVSNKSLIVTLRNDYTKDITGYKMRPGVGTVYTEFLSCDNESVFRPGDTREEIYPVQSGLQESGFELLAVIFDDGSADGNGKYVSEIHEYRAGLKVQREHAVRLLEGLSRRAAASISAAIDAIKAKIARVSAEEEAKLSRHTRFGIDDERDCSLRQLGKIKEMLDAPDTTPEKANETKLILKRAEDSLATLLVRYSESLKRL